MSKFSKLPTLLMTPVVVFIMLLLTLNITVMTSWAADMKNTGKPDKKAGALSGKCWKRTWVSSEALMGRSTMSICRAFEEVLNTTCEPPEKLKCNWTLPPGEKRFKKLTWEPLDWRAYWGFIKDSRVSGMREDLRENLWKTEEHTVRKAFEWGHRSLSMATVDIDHDGNTEQVLRVNLLPCDETAGTIFGVIKPDTKRLDWSFEYVFGDVNATDGGEIILYEGKAYMFGWDRDWKILMVYEGCYKTNINICQFEYVRGGKEK